MKKIFITGMAGSGKSTLAAELKRRGMKVVDFDEAEGLCSWKNKLTGEDADYYPGIGKEWLESHDWECDTDQLSKLVNSERGDGVIIFVGVMGNQASFLDSFDKVYLLQIDEETLIERLTNRNTNDFAQDYSERQYLLGLRKKFESDTIQAGAVPLAATESVQFLADRIVTDFSGFANIEAK
jgi:dephospho-CoA kinase